MASKQDPKPKNTKGGIGPGYEPDLTPEPVVVPPDPAPVAPTPAPVGPTVSDPAPWWKGRDPALDDGTTDPAVARDGSSMSDDAAKMAEMVADEPVPLPPFEMPGYYPLVDNPDGTRSNVVLASRTDDKGVTYAIPTMWDGEEHDIDQAWSRAIQLGLEKFPQGKLRDVEYWISQNHANIVGSANEPQMDVALILDTPEKQQAATTLKDRLRSWNPTLVQRLDDAYTRAARDAGDESLPQHQRLMAKLGMNKIVKQAVNLEQSDAYIAFKEGGMRDDLRKAQGLLEGSIQPLPPELNKMRGNDLSEFHRGYMRMAENAYYANSTVMDTRQAVATLLDQGDVDDLDGKKKLEGKILLGLPNYMSAPGDVDKWSHDVLREAHALTANDYTKEDMRVLNEQLETIRTAGVEGLEKVQRRAKEIARYGGNIDKALDANPFGYESYIIEDTARANVEYNLRLLQAAAIDSMEEAGVPKEETLRSILDGMGVEARSLQADRKEFFNMFKVYAESQGWKIPADAMPSLQVGPGNPTQQWARNINAENTTDPPGWMGRGM